MTRAEIAPFITGSNDPFFQLDLFQNVALQASYSIIDLISDRGGPAARMGGGTQSLMFPGTKANNKIFKFIFEINISGSYNANKQALLRIYQDEIIVFDGACKLDTINKSDEGEIIYNCTGSSGFSNIYAAWQNNGVDLLIQDLDWSDLDHFYSTGNITASWSATPGATNANDNGGVAGNGYVYPMIDFGENDLHGWHVDHFYPAVYVIEILSRAFAYAGFTFKSAFFTNTGTQPFDFRRLIVPFNGGVLKYSAAEITSRQFFASYIGSAVPITNTFSNIPFNDTNPANAPDNDPSAQWNIATHEWTVPVGKTGTYAIELFLHLNCAGGSIVYGQILKNGVTVLQSFGGTLLVGATTMSNGGPAWSGVLTEGDVIAVQIRNDGTPGCTIVAQSTPAQTRVYTVAINNGVTEDETWSLASGVPQNVKISDFFKSIVAMCNLYVDIDPDNPTTLIIEPRDAFYASGTVLDWTNKWDVSKPIEITPIGRHLAKNYLFTYSPDTDYWNTLYSQRYYFYDHNQIYGEIEEITDNDYLTDTKKTDILFAPTPLVFYPQIGTGPVNDKVLATIHFGGNSNNGQDATNTSAYTPAQKPGGSVPRILYWGGMINCATWYLQSAFTSPPYNLSSPQTQYPYAGHLDEPETPSVDVNFWGPNQLFYQFPIAQSYTNANLYNLFYQSFIDEITDADSKLVKMTVKLNPMDIMQLDFRNLILIKDTYYKLLEVTDFDMSTNRTCTILLLKSTAQPGVDIVTGAINGGGGMIGNMGMPIIIGNKDSQAARIAGDSVRALGGSGNTVSQGASNVLITGNDNAVFGQSQGVAIHGGGGNTVLGNNVTLINCTNLNITDNDVVYINNALYVPVTDPTFSDLAARSGTASMTAGATAAITFAGVTGVSIIIVTPTDAGTFAGVLSVNAGAGSFTINSSVPTDNGQINWFIVKL